MLNRSNRWPWLLLLGSLVGGVVLGRSVFAPKVPPAEKVYLPGDIVVQKVIDHSAMRELAAERDDLLIINDELRDENGRLLSIKQSFEVDTGPVGPPDPVFVDRVVKEICDSNESPLGRARIDARQYEGLTDDGALAYGWRGSVQCEIAESGGADWALLVDQPFTLANTRADGIVAPAAPKRVAGRIGWYIGGSAPLSSAVDVQSYRLPARGAVDFGGSLRLGKRWHVQVGGQFSDEWAVDARLLRYGWRRAK